MGALEDPDIGTLQCRWVETSTALDLEIDVAVAPLAHIAAEFSIGYADA